MKECLYYNKGENLLVECLLCPRVCIIKEGSRGFCRVRYNEKGVLYTENEYISSIALDPIEKKPLFHYYPGSKILSVGGSGCNFHCSFCQNWEISQSQNRNNIFMAPKELVDRAEGLVSSGNIGIAYTYSDPIVMFEYVLETAVLAKRKNLKNIFVSNGYIEADPLDDLLEYIDAFNIDIKAFSQDMYKKHFNADISIIKRNLEAIVKKGRHLEISCLIVPGVNDRIEEAENFFIWLMELSEDIPVHINRYFPCYKATMPPTKMEVLREIKSISAKYMKNVYIGNI